ncbi:hypothetical protein [uncultured Sphingobacterium sp.]|uniref:hypothetical protein n=1 Tax=uncultured Sphingobacterium sp. TaxID=182688 RepID=UPI0037480EF5
MKRIRLIAVASLMLLGLACTETQKDKKAPDMKQETKQEDYLTFKLSDKVIREQVYHINLKRQSTNWNLKPIVRYNR